VSGEQCRDLPTRKSESNVDRVNQLVDVMADAEKFLPFDFEYVCDRGEQLEVQIYARFV